MAEQTFTDSNFQSDVVSHSGVVVVDFWAPWCGPCRMVSPIIEELAAEYHGKVTVGKLNVDENQQTAGEYGIMSIPTVMIFKAGKPVNSMIGAQSKDSYKRAIEEAIAS